METAIPVPQSPVNADPPDAHEQKSATVPAEPAHNKLNKNLLVIITAISSVILLLLILIVVLLGAQKNSGNQPTPTPTPSPTVTTTATATPTSTPEPANAGRILYLFNNNIWIVNNDGTGKKQLTADGTADTIRYSRIDWKAPGVISYAECSDSCSVYTANADGTGKTAVFTAAPFTQSINALRWSHDGTMLAYYFEKGDHSKSLVVRKGSTEKTLKNLPAIEFGRGGSYEDIVDLQFSADDNYISFVNTITATASEPVVYIFKNDGTPVVTMLAPANFPTFGSAGVYYRKGTSVRYQVSGGADSAVASVTAINLQASPNGKLLAYWNLHAGTDAVEMFTLDTATKSAAKLADSLRLPKWLDSNTIVALKTKAISDGYFPYEDVGMVKINITTKAVTTISNDAAEQFEVED